MWGREAADFKDYSCARKGVERVWLPSATSGGASATLQAVFVDSGYQSPDEIDRCDYGAKDSTCNGSWGAKDLASLISDIDTFRAPNVRGKSVLLNLGDDFTAENAVLGTGQGDYMAYLDSVIAALNADPSGRFTAFYSTAADYLAEELATVPTFPVVTGDFFPYNDDSQGHNMWAGYVLSCNYSRAVRQRIAHSPIALTNAFLTSGTSRRARASRASCASLPRTCSRRASCRRSWAAPRTSRRPTRSSSSSAPWASRSTTTRSPARRARR